MRLVYPVRKFCGSLSRLISYGRIVRYPMIGRGTGSRSSTMTDVLEMPLSFCWAAYWRRNAFRPGPLHNRSFRARDARGRVVQSFASRFLKVSTTLRLTGGGEVL